MPVRALRPRNLDVSWAMAPSRLRYASMLLAWFATPAQSTTGTWDPAERNLCVTCANRAARLCARIAVMDATLWDDRYAASDLVWSAEPNATVATLTADLPPGRALDVAAGEGRNAIWLAERGWDADAVDFSPVGLARAERLAAQRLSNAVAAGADVGRFRAIVADVTAGWEPEPQAYDLVLVIFLHLPVQARAAAHRAAAAALAPGGLLVVLAHDRSNLAEGVGGPQDPAILPTPEEVVADLADTGLTIERAEVIARTVDGADRPARDCLVLARRSA